MRRKLILGCLGTLVLTGLGWDAPGHRAITDAAITLLPAEMPAWLRDADVRAQIAYQSNEPDHYRGTKIAALTHANGPEHYIDVELLEKHQLSLATLPPLRYEFVAQLVRTTTEPAPVAPEGSAPGTPARRGVDRRMFTDEVGFAPYAIVEHYAKLVSSFNSVRMLERLNDPARANQLLAARANVVHEMGQLSHFVGDVAQPLHTTIHHHGWIGDNPDHFTTDRGFHAYIDGEIVAKHGLNSEVIIGATPSLRAIAPNQVFREGVGLIERSFATVRPLYEMHRDGTLVEPAGRTFILGRMSDAAAALAGLYATAWKESEPTEEQIKDFVRFDKLGEGVPAAAPAPAAAPTSDAPGSTNSRPTPRAADR
jgi:hypothetical protein